MALGDPDDVLRSLRRFVWLALGGQPWKARLQRSRVEDDERPVAVVEQSAPLTTAHGGAGTGTTPDLQYIASYVTMLYPTLATDPATGRLEAAELSSLLLACFTRGLLVQDDEHAPIVPVGAPFAFPIYDFAGVPVVGADRNGPTEPYAHAIIDRTLSIRAIQDPLDELRFSIACSLRCSWWAPGRVEGGPLVEAMPGRWVNPPAMAQRPPWNAEQPSY